MVQHAASAGANAVIGMRYDANEIAQRWWCNRFEKAASIGG